jgi:hypothetical protein
VDGVLDVAVTPHRSPIVGALVKARLWLGAGVDRAGAELRIRDACRQQLPEYMVPRLYEYPDHDGLGATLKLDRRGRVAD